MIRSLLPIAGVLFATLALAGCSDDDYGKTDMLPIAVTDASATVADMTVVCTSVATWPTTTVYATGASVQDPDINFVDDLYALRPDGSDTDTFGVELFQSTASLPSYPRSFTIAATDTYETCNDCVVLYVNLQADGTYDKLFFGVSGSVTLTRADTDPMMGEVQASGQNIKLVEWDDNLDAPVTGGGCFEVGSFSFAATYSNAVDGGADL